MAEEIKTGKKEPEKIEKTEKNDKAVKEVKDGKEKVKLGDKIKKFFKDYRSELKKVVWPTKSQLIQNTGVVLVAITFMAIVVGVLDLAFGFGVQGLSNLKTLITGS
jgi:preprotein translocase subunit SecE